jgi:hypothetical protein
VAPPSPPIHSLTILPTPNDSTINPINSRLRLHFDEVVESASSLDWAIARDEQMMASQDTLVTVKDEDDTDDGHFSAFAYIYKLRIVVMHTKVQSRLGYSGVRSETQSFHYTILLKVNTGSPSLVGLLGSLTISDLPSPRIRTKISYLKPIEGSLYTTEIIKFGVYRGMLWSVTMMPTSLLLLEAPPSRFIPLSCQIIAKIVIV